MKVSLPTKIASSFAKTIRKDDVRYYTMGLHVDQECKSVVWSDSMTLIKVKNVEITDADDSMENSTIIRRSEIEKKSKIAKVNKEEFTQLELNSETQIDGRYPAYRSAYPKKINLEFSLDVAQLKKIVDFLDSQKGKSGEERKVTFKIEDTTRPIQIDMGEIETLIVPMRLG